MEELDILDESAELMDQRIGRRPVFLTVLCILTWVGCGLGLIAAIFKLWTYAAVDELTRQLVDATDDRTLRNEYSILYWQALGGLFSAIMCTVGAVFMFRLRKIGFFIYLLGQLVPLALGVLGVMSSKTGMGHEFAIIMTAISFIFPIGFIAMYGVNLKHMR